MSCDSLAFECQCGHIILGCIEDIGGAREKQREDNLVYIRTYVLTYLSTKLWVYAGEYIRTNYRVPDKRTQLPKTMDCVRGLSLTCLLRMAPEYSESLD